VLADPMPGACRAAARLYGRPVVVADGGALPFPDATFDAAWCLGVLSTVPHQARVVGELRRVVRDGGAVGWLVFVRTGSLPEQPEGNHFPDQDGLAELLARAGLTVTAEAALADFPAADESWRHQADLVDRVVERDHGGDERLRSADEQAATMGRLLDDGLVVGRLLVTRAG
ncbi:MAG: methyltransferase domain-containing protein, partial [Nocardioidaceae bacterium]